MSFAAHVRIKLIERIAISVEGERLHRLLGNDTEADLQRARADAIRFILRRDREGAPIGFKEARHEQAARQ